MIKVELEEKEKEGLTEEEIELAIARKLELMVLPHIKRNINFFYAGANIPKKSRAYNQRVNEEDLEQAIQGKKNPIPTSCRRLCKMVAQILRDNGLNARTVSCDTDIFRHTDVLLTTKSGKQYIINYLEDAENIQTGMSTPDFASKKYYERRYKKFEGRETTDGKILDRISFLSEEQLGKIDTNLGYKKYGMYMDAVIAQIREEFKDFRSIMADGDYINEVYRVGKMIDLTEEQKQKMREKFEQKYKDFSDDEILEQKLDWIFNFFNERMDITGHTDFVMYYSRLLLKEVLSPEEYGKITRYDCFIKKNKVTPDCMIRDVLDFDNDENKDKMRFCMIKLNDKAYVFSTKPKVYKKLSEEQMKELGKTAHLAQSQKPSDLVLALCDRGNALPLVFHPLGSEMLNLYAKEVGKDLPPEERAKKIEELSRTIKTTDKPYTTITIPFSDGEQTIFIDPNQEFAVRDLTGDVTVYHYNDDTDSFEKEFIPAYSEGEAHDQDGDENEK